MKTPRGAKTHLQLALLAIGLMASASLAQYGTILSGTGPTNRSMAGASTAAPLSASGALYWNPATLTGLERSELEAGVELLFVNTQASSRTGSSAFGPGIPPISLAGSTDSDTGAFPLPTIGLAYRPEGSDLSFGLGVYAVAGFGVDYAGSATNGPLTPPPPTGFGFGPVYSEFQVLQVHPAIAYQLSDRVSVGAGPTLDLATLRGTPGLFVAPDDANGDGFFTYPQGQHSETTWGGGFDAGVYYHADTWAAGASVKSPQWFDRFRFNSADERGRARKLTVDLDLPMILSVGAAYTGMDHWLFAVDVRYIDYGSANTLGDTGARPDGSVRGLGWKSIFAVALGAQYQVSDSLSVRLGYSWNENPVPDSQSFINTLAPVVVEHTAYVGVTWNATEDLSMSLAYAHGFENSIEGPVLTPLGPVARTAVRNTTSADTVLFGVTLKLGAKKCADCAEHCPTHVQ